MQKKPGHSNIKSEFETPRNQNPRAPYPTKKQKKRRVIDTWFLADSEVDIMQRAAVKAKI